METGWPIQLLLWAHVAISIVGIVAGLVSVVAMAGGRHAAGWVAVFLGTTLLTCLTGFPLPPYGMDPPRIVGFVTLAALLPAISGLYLMNLVGVWRPIYVVGSMIALYLNAFVAITQAFLKVAPLHAAAPTQTEWPFIAGHGVGLLIFTLLGLYAYLGFARPRGASTIT